MKTNRGIVFVAAVGAALFLAGCVYYQPGVSAQFRAGKQSVQSGEIATLTADAWSSDGSSITYAWTEDGVQLDASGPSLSWSRFVTVDSRVAISLTVQSASGASRTVTKDIFVTAAQSPATLMVVNDSPYPAFYLFVSQSGDTDWGPDQLRPSATIPARGGSFTLEGVPGGLWDVMAEGASGSPVWKSTQLSFGSGQVVVLHLY